MVFHHHASDCRLLGLHEQASYDDIRSNKRLLLKWLHPDRNHNSWETKLFHRVQAAVDRLENEPDDKTKLAGPSVQNFKTAQHVRRLKREKHKNSNRHFWQIFRGLRIVKFGIVVFLMMVILFFGMVVAGEIRGFNFLYEALN